MASFIDVTWNPIVITRILNEREKALIAAGFQIEAYIKNSMKKGGGKDKLPSPAGNAPYVQTGRLRASITTNWTDSNMERAKPDNSSEATKDSDGIGNPGGGKLNSGKVFKVVVGTNVEYGCIFSASTPIFTDKGVKRISFIKEGDKVLTQTGEYKEVLKVIRKKALLTPNLITFEVEWRKGDKKRVLTVTEDHKILVFREGRNKWVQAKDVLETDLLFSKKKLSKNKGISKYNSGSCPVCNKEIKASGGPPKKYCSKECISFALKNGQSGHIGLKRSDESKKKMSISAKKRIKEYPETHANYIMAKKGYMTSSEKEIYKWLSMSSNFKKVIKRQYKIGSHFVDFYLPFLKEVYEADGSFWHQDQLKDIIRDEELLNEIPDLKITHIHFWDDRFSPKDMICNPLPNVYYSVCNPNINSYVNLESFEAKKIISIKKWKYGNDEPKDKRARWHGSVFDIMVKDVHSYFAAGILVSNSMLEFGTTKMQPRPFMRPALDRFKPKILKMIAKIK
jgi:very-short-patch-repair endonuclease